MLHTDASGVGWGATIAGGAATAGIWSQSESLKHINVLELLAIKLTLSSLLNVQTGIHVQVLCDNTTAVSYITAMGGTKSVECNAPLASDIWHWAITRNIWLSAAHIPGVSNVAADNLSRDLNLDLEWMLSCQVFMKFINIFGQPNIDLFGSRLNTQLFVFANYVSWKPDPQAKFVDSFTVVWSDMFFYAFPPFCLLPRCVQKITQEQATGILVIPLWTTQPIFSTVLHMLIDAHQIVKASQSNLVHPALVRSHPLHNKLDLLVCKLSGNSYKSQDFQRTLLTSSCPPGDHLSTSSTLSTSTSGYTFVINNKLIPCIHL